MSNNKHPIASVAVFVTHRYHPGQILLGERYYNIKKGKTFEYALPGGKVDWMEGIEDAAIREVREETGITVKIKHFLGIADDRWPDLDLHFVCHYYHAVYVSGTVTDMEPKKQRNWKWIDVKGCPTIYGQATVVLLKNMKYFTQK